MTKGLLPWSLAYWFARETTQAGVSETPLNQVSQSYHWGWAFQRPTHQVEDFTRCHNIMQTVHNFLDGCTPVPPVDVEDIDIAGAKLL